MTNKGGRPRFEPTEKELEQIRALSGMNCSWDEIAAVLYRSKSTLEKNKDCKAAFREGKDHGKASLKKAMFDSAVKNGNVTMMIWLSKILLGYKEVKEIETEGDGPAFVSLGAYDGKD